jgi:uncharacterized protein YciI
MEQSARDSSPSASPQSTIALPVLFFAKIRPGGSHMPYFAVFYDVIDDFVARRAAFREKHLRRVSESYASGELLLGGALADPADRALLIFHAHDKGVVESFIHNDPYVTNGLVKKWEIRPWNVVSGNEASPNPAAPARPSEIARVWTARTTEDKWPLYREHFSKNVLAELQAINGYLWRNSLCTPRRLGSRNLSRNLLALPRRHSHVRRSRSRNCRRRR